MEKTITVNDSLESCVESAKEEVKTEVVNYLNGESGYSLVNKTELECVIFDLEQIDADDCRDKISDRMTEIVDGCVPIYTREIKTAFFLHGSELEEAYENYGIGVDVMDHDGMTAIFCYIDQEVNNDFDDIFAKAVEKVIENLKKENADLPIDDE